MINSGLLLKKRGRERPKGNYYAQGNSFLRVVSGFFIPFMPLLVASTILLLSSPVWATQWGLDPSFGGVGGYGLAIYDNPFGGPDEGYGVAIQEIGDVEKIIVVGYTYNGTGNDIAVWRYNPDGKIDRTFGTGGVFIYLNVAGDDQAKAIAIQSDNKIVITGSISDGGETKLFVLRLEEDGEIDPTFANGGLFLLEDDERLLDDCGNSIKIQADDKIVVVGTILSVSLA